MKRSRKRNESVTQNHSMGCGLACVAYVAGSTYNDVFSKCDIKHYAWTRGFYCPELVSLLNIYNQKYLWRRFKKSESPDQLPNETIVFLSPDSNYPLGHFLVKVGKNCFMNPWRNFPHINPAKSGFQMGVGRISYVLIPVLKS